MKIMTLVTFVLNGETISRYFEGKPTLQQINNITGHCVILEIKRTTGDFPPDYKKAKNIFGYTAA